MVGILRLLCVLGRIKDEQSRDVARGWDGKRGNKKKKKKVEADTGVGRLVYKAK